MRKVIQRILRGYCQHPLQALFMTFVILVICSVLLLLFSPTFEGFFGHDPSTVKTIFGFLINAAVLAFAVTFGGWIADANSL